MNTRTLPLCLLFAAACASSEPNLNPKSTPAGPTRITSEGGGQAGVTYELPITSSARASSHPIPASMERAWPELLRVYGELDIPITVLDTAKHLVGNQNASVKRKLAGESLSTFLNCGRTPARAHAADQYDVNMSVLSLLKSSSDGNATLETFVTGRAKNPVNNDPAARCSSTGRLEQRIANSVTLAAGVDTRP